MTEHSWHIDPRYAGKLGEQVAREAERRSKGDPRNFQDAWLKARRWTLTKYDKVVQFPGNEKFRTEWLEACAYEDGLKAGYAYAKYEAELGVL
jgi:hypothetical protein